ncbi:putative membrane protein [Roseospira goensis]|uniref:Putative membrane protein n=2 Tax=Roseospira goensis TaxID=391922 RepID=A0A7W6WIS3_9PROT|nr:putative membrane protein [Roseospira goensis]
MRFSSAPRPEHRPTHRSPRRPRAPRALVLGAAGFLVTLVVSMPALAGLEVCNQTNVTRWLAIGYMQDGLWTSEGWWELEPGDCATPIQSDLTQRYYYYRAEDPDERFEGDGYVFCAVDDAFTIAGDTDCVARGYEELDFREIDTGAAATTFTLVLSPRTVPGAQPLSFEGPDDRGAPAAPVAPEEQSAALPSVSPATPAAPPEPAAPATAVAPTSDPPAAAPPQAPETGAAETRAPETGTAETETAETGAAETGAAETGAAETGAADAGSATGTNPFGGPVAALPGDNGDPLAATYRAVLGTWRSLDDRANRIRFDEDLYAAYHAGDLMETGPFEVAERCPVGDGGGGEPTVVVRLPGADAPQCYGVLYVDETTLELLALPRGNLLRYEAVE